MTDIPPPPAHYRVMRLEDADWKLIDNWGDLNIQREPGTVLPHYLLTVERPEEVYSLPYHDHRRDTAELESMGLHRQLAADLAATHEPHWPNVSLCLHCHTPPTLEQIEAMQRLSGLGRDVWLAGSPREPWKLPGKWWIKAACVFENVLLLPEEWVGPPKRQYGKFDPQNNASTSLWRTAPAHLLDLYEQAQACGMKCYLGGEV